MSFWLFSFVCRRRTLRWTWIKSPSSRSDPNRLSWPIISGQRPLFLASSSSSSVFQTRLKKHFRRRFWRLGQKSGEKLTLKIVGQKKSEEMLGNERSRFFHVYLIHALARVGGLWVECFYYWNRHHTSFTAPTISPSLIELMVVVCSAVSNGQFAYLLCQSFDLIGSN